MSEIKELHPETTLSAQHIEVGFHLTSEFNWCFADFYELDVDVKLYSTPLSCDVNNAPSDIQLELISPHESMNLNELFLFVIDKILQAALQKRI